MHDLIWLQTGFIGDIVLTTAAIDLAAHEWPGVRQHLVTTAAGAAATAGHPALATTLILKKSIGGLLQTRRTVLTMLQKPHDAVTLQVHRSYRSSLLALSLGLPTITYDETNAGFLAGTRVPRVAVLHEAQRIALLLEPLGIPRAQLLAARPKLLPLPIDEGTQWQRQLAAFPGRLIGIAPGSVWGTKRWTSDGFIGLSRRLLADPTLGIVLIGASADQVLCRTIAAALGAFSERVFDLGGRTGLQDLCRVLPRLSLLVGNDSAPLHFASALNLPTVALFGATVAAMGFGPLSTRSRVLGVDGLPCRPCSLHGPQVCPLQHFKCMRELSVDKVYAAVMALGAGESQSG